MRQDVAVVPTRAVTLPPRPNLGPEPWGEPGPPGWWLWAILAVLGLFAIRAIARRRRKPVERMVSAEGSPAPAAPTDAVEFSEALRALLGGEWQSKTTEELARDGELRAWFDVHLHAEVIHLLERADRLKFGAGPQPRDNGMDCGHLWARVGERLAAREAAPGASAATSHPSV